MEYLKPVLVPVGEAATLVLGAPTGDGDATGAPGQNLNFALEMGLDD
jgi:hypothetical protein